MKKIIVIAAIMGMVCPNLFAQSDIDALRYSLTDPTGSTARSLGLGGSVGAVGADPSTILSNPAGLAQFKTNVFNFSIGSINGKNQADYLDGPTKTTNIFKPILPSVNLVFTERKMTRGEPAKTGWVNHNFSIGWNKTADFNRTISYKGTNRNSSFTDQVAAYANGVPASVLEDNDEPLINGFAYYEDMFWYSYLIDSFSDGNYYANYDNLSPNISQSGVVTSKGGMNEFNLAFAANYEHKVYFGFGLNIHSVRYSEKNVFSEVDNPTTTDNWKEFDFTRNLETSGIGYSGRFGMIFRPNNNVRIGGTIHTPTGLTLTDKYDDELSVIFDDASLSPDNLKTIDKEHVYTITTPMKYGVQAAYIFGKKGLISAEIETIDYSTMSLSDDDDSYDLINEKIADTYQNTMNMKIGGEYVFDAFRVRGGFASIGNPLANSSDFSRKIITAGIGIQEKSWGFDFGISKDLQSDIYVPYEVSGLNPGAVESKFNSTRLVLTLTSKF